MGAGLQITELGVFGVPVSINLQFLLDGVGLVRATEVGLICLRSSNNAWVNLFEMNKHEAKLLEQEFAKITRTNIQAGLLQLTAEELGQIMQRSVTAILGTRTEVRSADVILRDLDASLIEFAEVTEAKPATIVKEDALFNLRDTD
jgi:hypothetical protein